MLRAPQVLQGPGDVPSRGSSHQLTVSGDTIFSGTYAMSVLMQLAGT